MLSPLEHFSINYISYIIFCTHSEFGIDSFIVALVGLSFMFVVIIKVLELIRFINFSDSLFLDSCISLYKFFIQMIRSQLPGWRFVRIFPVVVSLFVFILFANLFSLSFFTFSVTGHIIITLSLSLVLFLTVIFWGILNNQFNFFYLFSPGGVSGLLYYFLVLIELLSFFIRPFSLAIRLFANMLAGHILLNIFASFAYFVSFNAAVFFIVPFVLCTAIFVLELGVGVIQAYVFVVLFLVYISDIVKVEKH